MLNDSGENVTLTQSALTTQDDSTTDLKKINTTGLVMTTIFWIVVGAFAMYGLWFLWTIY